MPSFRLPLAACGLFALAATQAALAAPVYHLVDLGHAEAVSINGAGTVAGTQYCEEKKCGKPSRAAIYRNGAWHKLDTGNAALGIDDAGNVVGDDSSHALGLYWPRGAHSQQVGVPVDSDYVSPVGVGAGVAVGTAYEPHVDHCFTWTDGVGTELSPTATVACNGTAINAKGWVTGSAWFPGQDAPIYEAFVWHDGEFHDLGDLVDGRSGSSGAAINRAGHVAGTSATSVAFVQHAFLHDGQMHDLGVFLPGGSSAAAGINARDEVVGASTAAGWQSHAFLYTGGALLDLNALVDNPDGWQLTSANAINDSGTIVGSAFLQGEPRAFMAVRISE